MSPPAQRQRVGRCSPLRTACTLLAAGLALLACGDESSEPTGTAQKTLGSDARPQTAAERLRTDDLPGIRRSGELRILALSQTEAHLARDGAPAETEHRLAEDLAADLGLVPRFVYLDDFGKLLVALNEGRGDIIAENVTVTEQRSGRFLFSSPLDFVREQVVVRADEDRLGSVEALAGRRLAVQPATSFWKTAQKLRQRIPTLEIEKIPNDVGVDVILDGVSAGTFDLALADSNVVTAVLGWREDVKVGFSLPGHRIIAWPMRPDARELKKAVDRFLARAHGGQMSESPAVDLGDIVERKVLRVLTRNSDTTYFIWRGQVMGFEFELAERFAEELGVRLEIVVPPSRDALIPWLLQGKGDIATAGLTASPERAAREGVAFSRYYQKAVEMVAARADDTALRAPADLAGRVISVRESSSYWRTLEALRAESGVDFTIAPAPEELETEEILARVATGEFDLTVADSPILDVALTWNDNLRAAFPIGTEAEYGWAVRPESVELLASIDAFLKREYRGLFYNVVRRKYFEDPRKIRKHLEFRASRAGQISPYDDIVRDLARQFGFDWRLVVAQMYQESRFDPKARSFAGARGLLQVMPRTARELGISDLSIPANGLEAGIRYLDWTRDRFEPTLSTDDRIWFSLAAYNVGFGHVNDARRIAREQGLDPDRWFDHVEQAMLLKEKPEVHRKTRFGFARGREPVNYVRAIRDRYAAYLEADTRASVTPVASP